MEKRRLGRTGHMSTVITFGCAALGNVSQDEADDSIKLALSHGVNHFDVAPTYREAELRLCPWMKEHRDDIFLACKTGKRTKKEAAEELNRSLKRLGVDYFDLYQFHGLDDLKELDIAFGPDGALEAMLEARDKGVVKYIGITSHRPQTHIEALKRFGLDTVLFPLNFVLRRHRVPENDYGPLLKLAEQKDAGVIVMKAFAKQTWSTEKHAYRTWYEPFDTQVDIDRCLWFALSQGVTTVASAGDIRLIPKILDAAERYRKLSKDEQDQLIGSATNLKPLFPRG
jgi:aryl-alcohol dehydrogenase-like predicted oxidoreductase